VRIFTGFRAAITSLVVTKALIIGGSVIGEVNAFEMFSQDHVWNREGDTAVAVTAFGKSNDEAVITVCTADAKVGLFLAATGSELETYPTAFYPLLAARPTTTNLLCIVGATPPPTTDVTPPN
jgi:hypothetical protein